MKRIKTGRTSELLSDILIAGGTITLSLLSPKIAATLLKSYSSNKDLSGRTIRNDIDYLNRRGLLVKNKIGKALILKLTEEGRQSVLLYEATSKPIKSTLKWNGNLHLTSFDIPEKKAKIRKKITYHLFNIGCIQVQKSLYVSPYYYRDKLSVIAQHYQVEDCFRYYIVPDQSSFALEKMFFFGKE